MQSIFVAFVHGLIRYFLVGFTGWLIGNGIINEEQTSQLVTGIASAVCLILTLLWLKYKERVLVLTGLKMPAHSSPAQLVATVKEASKDGTGLKPTIMGSLLLFCFSASLAGCGSGQAIVSPNPTPEAVVMVQREALQAVAGIRIGLNITRQLGASLESFGLPPAEAEALDCAIVKVVGTPTLASPAVVAACGPVPLTSEAPMTLALNALSTATTCPGLQSTLAAARPAIMPMLDRFMESENAQVRILGASLQLAFVALGPGGVRC